MRVENDVTNVVLIYFRCCQLFKQSKIQLENYKYFFYFFVLSFYKGLRDFENACKIH